MQTAEQQGIAISAPVPLYELAQNLVAEGLVEVEAVIGIPRPDQLEIWIVVDDANRDVRRRIHAVEWAVMLKYPEDDIHFELLRRRGRPLEALLTPDPSSIIVALRGHNAQYPRACSAS